MSTSSTVADIAAVAGAIATVKGSTATAAGNPTDVSTRLPLNLQRYNAARNGDQSAAIALGSSAGVIPNAAGVWGGWATAVAMNDAKDKFQSLVDQGIIDKTGKIIVKANSTTSTTGLFGGPSLSTQAKAATGLPGWALLALAAVAAYGLYHAMKKGA